MTYGRNRNIERSIKEYLITQIDANWSGVTTDFAFVDKEQTLPLVTIHLDSVTRKYLEVGNSELDEEFSIIIMVYAKSDAQRLDLASFIIDALKNGCLYYKYVPDSGGSGDPLKLKTGHIGVEFVDDMKIYPLENCESYSRFVHRISILARIQLL